MPMLTVIRDIDKAAGNPLLSKTEEQIIEIKEPITIGTMSAGMESGKTSVCLCIPYGDKVIFAETSLELMKAALRILDAIPE